MTFKFEGFMVGDKVRAYDFEPMEGRKPRYVEGIISEVREKGTSEHQYSHYVIIVDVDTLFDECPRGTVYAPMETSMDFDNRIIKVR